jgi:hypothetical protein
LGLRKYFCRGFENNVYFRISNPLLSPLTGGNLAFQVPLIKGEDILNFDFNFDYSLNKKLSYIFAGDLKTMYTSGFQTPLYPPLQGGI